MRQATLGAFLFALCLAAPAGQAATKNGFDISGSLVPQDQILSGGPRKDGIPAIDKPRFLRADEAGKLKPDDRVLGITINDIAKAYPISILSWHEIVNDSIGDQAFIVTYCPLCGTGMAFSADLDGEVASFGVSGLLYESDVLLYDRPTNSLWSQILRQAVSGPMKGRELTMLPLQHTTWGKWQSDHPDTLVLSRETGYLRDYDTDPYANYEESTAVLFRVSRKAPSRYHPKDRVLGVEIDGSFKAYPYPELRKHKRSAFQDIINGQQITVHWDEMSETATVTDGDGDEIPTVSAYWFAWYTFHPDTAVFEAGNR